MNFLILTKFTRNPTIDVYLYPEDESTHRIFELWSLRAVERMGHPSSTWKVKR